MNFNVINRTDLGRFRLPPRGDSPGREKYASLENTLVSFKPDTKKYHQIFCQFMTTDSTCFMIRPNIQCANYRGLLSYCMIYINHSFLPSLFLTEVQHYACALNIPICSTDTTMVSPGGLSGTLHCFRQLPGTPGEADESAPGRYIWETLLRNKIVHMSESLRGIIPATNLYPRTCIMIACQAMLSCSAPINSCLQSQSSFGHSVSEVAMTLTFDTCQGKSNFVTRDKSYRFCQPSLIRINARWQLPSSSKRCPVTRSRRSHNSAGTSTYKTKLRELIHQAGI